MLCFMTLNLQYLNIYGMENPHINVTKISYETAHKFHFTTNEMFSTVYWVIVIQFKKYNWGEKGHFKAMVATNKDIV